MGKNFFFSGMAVSLSIGDKPYQGSVISFEIGDNFVVKLAKADMTLLNAMLNSEVVVRCIADDGMAYGFKCRLKNRKIPLVTLTYPEGEPQGVNVRKEKRTPVSFWAELKIMTVSGPESESQLEALGDANIVDISLGGCKIMTHGEFKKGDPVWVVFSWGENEEPIELKGVVRGSRPAPYESTYYGLQFCDLDGAALEKIKKIMENPHE